MPIRVLPQHVAARIAAGEVVERPASVVRELIENAVDAGARLIQISFVASQIAVTDDGAGMPPEDLALCLEHHATSKLPDDDFRSISTLGFRGEALAAVAAVASVSVASRPRGQDAAFVVSARGGEAPSKVKPCAGGHGTRVTVGDLFFNHPARLKFLKSEKVERGWIGETVARAALAHPGIEFSLTMGRETRRFPRGGFHGRAAEMIPGDFAANAVPVSREADGMRLEAVVPLPSAYKNKGGQSYVVVNGRVVYDRTLVGAAASVYRSLIGSGECPPVVIKLDIDPELVDVNVHPTKSEVRFLRPDVVADFVRNSIDEALASAGMRTPAAVYEMARRLSGDNAETIADVKRLPLGRAMGQAGDKWIVAETADGLVIVDQHAAHERVVLERLKSAVHGGDPDMVRVSPPVTLRLSIPETLAVIEHVDTVRDLGFSVSLEGGVVSLAGYPSILSGVTPVDLLREIVAACERGAAGGLVGEAIWSTLATAACKAAIKAGDAMSVERAGRLLREMEATPGAERCNHGRPTMVFLKTEDIAKLFGR